MFLAISGCGKFQPTNAPTAIQNNVSNMVSPYSSGKGGITGAALPPNPDTTGDGVAAIGLVPQLGAGVYAVLGAGEPKPLEEPKLLPMLPDCPLPYPPATLPDMA